MNKKKSTNTELVNIEMDLKARCDVSWVKDYDFSKLPQNFAILMASQRRAGKTHLCKHLLYFVKNRFEHAYLFSKSAHMQVDAYDFIPKQNVYDTFDYEKIREIMMHQKRLREYNLKLPKDQQKDTNVLIMLDDVIADPSVRYGPGAAVINELFANGRHFLISIVCLSQELSSRGGFSTVVRKNCDVAIAFMIQDETTRQMFADAYLSIESKKAGKVLLNSITCDDDYTAIVADKSIPNIRGYKDYVFKARAPDNLKNFTIGIEDKKRKVFTDPEFNVYNIPSASGSFGGAKGPKTKNSLSPGMRAYAFQNKLKPGQKRLNLGLVSLF